MKKAKDKVKKNQDDDFCPKMFPSPEDTRIMKQHILNNIDILFEQYRALPTKEEKEKFMTLILP